MYNFHIDLYLVYNRFIIFFLNLMILSVIKCDENILSFEHHKTRLLHCFYPTVAGLHTKFCGTLLPQQTGRNSFVFAYIFAKKPLRRRSEPNNGKFRIRPCRKHISVASCFAKSCKFICIFLGCIFLIL